MKGPTVNQLCGILKSDRPVIGGNSSRPILLNQMTDLIRNLVKCSGAGDLRKCTISAFFKGLGQSLGLVHLLNELPAFNAGIAAIHGVTRVRLDR